LYIIYILLYIYIYCIYYFKIYNNPHKSIVQQKPCYSLIQAHEICSSTFLKIRFVFCFKFVGCFFLLMLHYIIYHIILSQKKHLFPRSELRWPWPCPLRPSWRQDGNGWQRAPQLEMNKNPTSGEVTREISTDGDMSGYFLFNNV